MRIQDELDLAEPEFSMAPLIDIVFQLLIFFMVATTYQKSERQLEIDLPTAETGARTREIPLEIVVDIQRDGRVFVAGRETQREALVEALAAASGGHDETPVTVRGDRATTHEVVVNVLDACGMAGLSNLSIGTLDGATGSER